MLPVHFKQDKSQVNEPVLHRLEATNVPCDIYWVHRLTEHTEQGRYRPKNGVYSLYNSNTLYPYTETYLKCHNSDSCMNSSGKYLNEDQKGQQYCRICRPGDRR